ncbi:hypothetical protein DEO72_LG5g2534 [Vigna unguiculata]|uniref:Uncharacterized protein n=1 Tax=Vigna unguiculata TaxID=3917 RepID=A0A4D6M0W6_VIGUN|nr:hypothetical protein DEO72_LG5g2534 [Vigna unguiculata]
MLHKQVDGRELKFLANQSLRTRGFGFFNPPFPFPANSRVGGGDASEPLELSRDISAASGEIPEEENVGGDEHGPDNGDGGDGGDVGYDGGGGCGVDGGVGGGCGGGGGGGDVGYGSGSGDGGGCGGGDSGYGVGGDCGGVNGGDDGGGGGGGEKKNLCVATNCKSK